MNIILSLHYHYDHHIIKPNKDIFLDDDKFANPQLTEKFFIKTPYVYTINSLDKKYDHVLSAALRNIQIYDSYFNKFNNFSLTFHFLTSKERDLLCSHDVMLRTKQTHTYTYYKFIQHHYTLYTPSYTIIDIIILTPNIPHLSFLTSLIVLKILTSKASSEFMTPSHILPLTKTFNVDEFWPLIVPQEFLQPVEVPILEFIHNTRCNHKLYNFIQNKQYEI